jgi:hypothetical protein
MIKRNQKWIALSVALTFAWLLQVSAMPLPAAGSSERVAVANSELEPGVHEAVAQKAAPAKKKSVLPYVLIGVGVLAATAVVLFLFVLNKYDITGTWSFVFVAGSDQEHFTLIFTGDKKSGTFRFLEIPTNTGPYAVDGKKVTITFNNFTYIKFIGEFTGKDSMSGTLDDGDDVWNWTATRQAAAAAAEPVPAVHSRLFPE